MVSRTLDSDSDAKDSDSSPQDLNSVHYMLPCTCTSIFKKIQWPFSVFSQLFTYLCPYSIVVCFYGGRVQSEALSRLHVSQTDIEVTGCTCN